MNHYVIELKKASELSNPKVRTTASGIRTDFNNRILPYYYHAYNPDNSFIAVPPELLVQLAEKANEQELADNIRTKIDISKSEKTKIIRKLQEKYHAGKTI